MNSDLNDGCRQRYCSLPFASRCCSSLSSRSRVDGSPRREPMGLIEETVEQILHTNERSLPLPPALTSVLRLANAPSSACGLGEREQASAALHNSRGPAGGGVARGGASHKPGLCEAPSGAGAFRGQGACPRSLDITEGYVSSSSGRSSLRRVPTPHGGHGSARRGAHENGAARTRDCARSDARRLDER